MPELTLNDVHRDSLAGELDCVGVTQLARGKPAAHPGRGGELTQSPRASARGGSGGYPIPLLRGALPARYPGIVAGDRRRPAASTNTIEPWAITSSSQTTARPTGAALAPILASRHSLSKSQRHPDVFCF